MRPMGIRLATISLLGGLLLGASACGFDGAVRDQFFQPSGTGDKLPLRVAVYDNGTLNPAPIKFGIFGEHEVALAPGIPNAVKAELASLFQDVTFATDPQQAGQKDLIVKITSAFVPNTQPGATMSFSLRPPGWKEELARYDASANVRYNCDCILQAFLTGVSLFLLTPVTIPWASAEELNDATEGLEQGTTAMLQDISAKIRADSRVAELVQTKKIFQASLVVGQQAESAGDRLKALEQYTRAALARPDPETNRKLRDKITTLAAGLGALPPATEEAVRHAVRANAHLKTATTDGYGPALLEMAQAVAAAPLWPEGYYNLGLIQETAGRYSHAAQSLTLYVLLAPQSSDAKAVQAKVYELEALAERADKNAK